MTISATITNATTPINRSGGRGRFMLMTAGGWLFMLQCGRNLHHNGRRAGSSKLGHE